jgi:hypothetical protein
VVDLDRLERILIQAALERRPVTYGQLLAYFEWGVTQITVAALCRDLGRVADRREGSGWPDLACLVVRKSDGMPGEGYFASLRAEGAYAGPSLGPAAEGFVRSRQERAFAWASEQAPATIEATA